MNGGIRTGSYFQGAGKRHLVCCQHKEYRIGRGTRPPPSEQFEFYEIIFDEIKFGITHYQLLLIQVIRNKIPAMIFWICEQSPSPRGSPPEFCVQFVCKQQQSFSGKETVSVKIVKNLIGSSRVQILDANFPCPLRSQ